jgi:hypothetical protein
MFIFETIIYYVNIIVIRANLHMIENLLYLTTLINKENEKNNELCTKSIQMLPLCYRGKEIFTKTPNRSAPRGQIRISLCWQLP